MEEIKDFVIYCRVSTREQGDSGLGLAAQLNTCRRYVEKVGGNILGEFSDVKSGSSKNRAGLIRALSMAKTKGATVVFGKLDRLSRDSEYAHSIRNSGVPLYFCDFPDINSLLFGILVAVAQYEKEIGQQRTKDALAAIQRKLKKGEVHISKSGRQIKSLGRARGSRNNPSSARVQAAWTEKISADRDRLRQWKLIRDLQGRGDTMEKIAETMNALDEKTPRGFQWTKGQVSRALSDWPKYFVKDGSSEE